MGCAGRVFGDQTDSSAHLRPSNPGAFDNQIPVRRYRHDGRYETSEGRFGVVVPNISASAIRAGRTYGHIQYSWASRSRPFVAVGVHVFLLVVQCWALR